MHRPTLGVLAIVLLVVGLAALVPGSPVEGALSLACLRVGIVLATLWLAQPQLNSLPRWLVVTIVVSLFAVMLRPRLLVPLIPILLLLAILRPRRWRR